MKKTELHYAMRVVMLGTAMAAISGSGTAVSAEIADTSNTNSLDAISVTASRIERGTKEVSSSIAVIDEQRIDAANMLNIKEAIQGTPGILIESGSGGYSSRFIIRGAGQKARYGVREIQVMRDGVPMTDPDSFTRFDFIDTQDIERIEITKGPGSLYGAGSAGGTVQIISKSVFDTEGNRVKVGLGEEGTENFNVRIAGEINESNAYRITASHRAADNNWRNWNAYESQQLSLKHGLMFDDGATLETELSYSEADIELAGTMNAAQFDEYKKDGKQVDNGDAWKHSGRYSTIWFFNTRYEKEWGDFTFRPRLYFNTWDHIHPVTGAINDNPGTDVLGADLEFVYKHEFWGPSSLVAGITGRRDDTDGAKKYQYRDYNTRFGRISETLSDKKGALMEEEDATNTTVGLYFQESMQPTDRLTADVSFRYDRMNFDVDTATITEYSYGAGRYVAAAGVINIDKTFHLYSPSAGLTYAVTDQVNVYGTVAQSDQVPSESEIQSNNSLEESTSRNYEVGVKGRAQNWSFDLALYKIDVTDDIVSSYDAFGDTSYSNAGEIDKTGLELSGRVQVFKNFWFGANYAYSDYEFDKFMEPDGAGGYNDHAGNHMPYVPRNQFSMNAEYNHPSGFKARVQADSWGEYYMDNANTEKYGGYDLVTSLMLGYETGPHRFSLNVDNLFDKHYATEVKKAVSGGRTKYSYQGASPRIAVLTYVYSF